MNGRLEFIDKEMYVQPKPSLRHHAHSDSRSKLETRDPHQGHAEQDGQEEGRDHPGAEQRAGRPTSGREGMMETTDCRVDMAAVARRVY